MLANGATIVSSTQQNESGMGNPVLVTDFH